MARWNGGKVLLSHRVQNEQEFLGELLLEQPSNPAASSQNEHNATANERCHRAIKISSQKSIQADFRDS